MTLPANRDFDVAIESIEKPQQSLHGESVEPVIRQRGDFWLIQPQQFCRRFLPQASFFQDFIDGDGEAHLR